MQLDPEVQEYLRHEIAAFIDRLAEPAARSVYAPLLPAVEAAEIPDDLLDPLGRVLELSLGSGRLRKLHGPQAEESAMRLFRRSPRGRAIQQTFDETNQALAGLQGQTIRSMSLAPGNPGAFALSIETDRCRARFILDGAGARCKSVELDF
jgi:hypothetical protein